MRVTVEGVLRSGSMSSPNKAGHYSAVLGVRKTGQPLAETELGHALTEAGLLESAWTFKHSEYWCFTCVQDYVPICESLADVKLNTPITVVLGDSETRKGKFKILEIKQ